MNTAKLLLFLNKKEKERKFFVRGGVKRRFGLKIRIFAPFFCGQSGAKPHILPVQEFVAKSITRRFRRLLCNVMKINELRIKIKKV